MRIVVNKNINNPGNGYFLQVYHALRLPVTIFIYHYLPAYE